MKKKFLQVFSLLMVIALMVITANAVVTDKPGITTSSAKVTLYGKDQTVQVTLTLPVCYGIEGYWSATATGKENPIALGEVTINAPHATVNGGEIAWADVYGEDPSLWLQNPIQGEKVTATYSIPAGTPAGSYMVTFTCTMFAGLDENNKITVTESDSEYVYTAMITVEQHACSDGATDGNHKCDDPLCGKDNVTEHKHNTYGSDGAQHWSICECGQMVGEKAAHTGGTATCMAQAVCETCEKAYGTLADHAWGEASYTDNGDGTHTASYICGTNPEHTKSDDPAAHTYDETTNKCVCGAEKPAATGLKGDVNLDGVVDITDVTALARHIAEIQFITDEVALSNAKVTGDDIIDIADLTKLARYVAEIIDSLD